MKRIHPEMQETIQDAMREGLRYWRDKTPAEIEQRVRRELLADQAVIKAAGSKGLSWHYEGRGCDAGCFMGHYPWCNVQRVLVWDTPEPEEKREGNVIHFRRGTRGL